MSINFYRVMRLSCVFFLSPLSSFAISSGEVTLAYVEKIAIERSPELEKTSNYKSAFESAAVAASQLKDPKLQLGLLNVPTDSFSLNQENMTQFKVGIAQEFPSGKTLHFASKAKKLMAETERYKLNNKKSEIIRNVRLYWMELYYLLEARKILEKNKKVFSYLVEVTTSKLSSGSGYQHDVLKSQIELTKIESLIMQNQEYIEQARVSLARLIGEELARKLKPEEIPKWPNLMKQEYVLEKLKQHPLIQESETLAQVAHAQLSVSKESYKPSWSAGIYYSARQKNPSMNNQKRSDFIGIQISTELPFFTGSRQDKMVSESSSQYAAAKSQSMIDYLDLKRQVAGYYANYTKLKNQEELYKKRLIAETKQYAESIMISYNNAQVESDMVLKAHNQVLNVDLQYLNIRAQKAQIRAQLLYLEATL
ncbi:MAG: TolC family protein [Francisellaceae bacterium]|nr:TolC family protein [Francisellaceae bacterium]